MEKLAFDLMALFSKRSILGQVVDFRRRCEKSACEIQVRSASPHHDQDCKDLARCVPTHFWSIRGGIEDSVYRHRVFFFPDPTGKNASNLPPIEAFSANQSASLIEFDSDLASDHDAREPDRIAHTSRAP
jgi:hypothetical protein